MGRNSDQIDYRKDYYKGIAAIYFRKILSTIIKYGDLKNEDDLVLDFGCGVGHLKKTLKKDNIIGFDIEPELTKIENYKNLSPKKIVLSGVLEHLYLPEVEDLLDDFLTMNKAVELLVYMPTENWVSKIAMRLARKTNAHDDHVSSYQEINVILDRYFQLKKRKYIFFHMAEISHFVPKQ